MKHYYAIAHTSFSMNDSDEKIKEWNTATVYRFTTKTARDNFVAESAYNYTISAKRALYIGAVDCDAIAGEVNSK